MSGILTNILRSINSFVGNYGWSIVVFTLLIKLVLLPLDIKSRKGMRKMQKIQPELNKLQQKYANDKVKLQQKQSELMRREHYNPLSGCLPLLIQMPILFAMFAAMRAIANEQIVQQVFEYLSGGTPTFEGWLWVRNIWMPDSLFAPMVPDMNSMRMIDMNVWRTAFDSLGAAKAAEVLKHVSATVEGFSGAFDFATRDGMSTALAAITQALGHVDSYKAAVAGVPGWQNLSLLITSITLFARHNGFLILPVFAGVSQVFMTKLTPGMGGEQPQPAANGQQQPGNMNGFMKYFFPVFTVYICLTSNAGFAIYWVVSNLIASASGYFIAKWLDNKEKATEAAAIEGTVK